MNNEVWTDTLTKMEKPKERRIKWCPGIFTILLLVFIAGATCYTVFVFNFLRPKRNPRKLLSSSENVEVILQFGWNILPFDPSKSVFIIDPSCAFHEKEPGGHFHIDSWKVCTAFSTAIINPEYNVYFLYSCRKDIPLFAQIQKRLVSNLYLVDLEEVLPGLFANSSIRSILPLILESGYQQLHVSSLLGPLMVWKYGGTYISSDIMVLPPLSTLGTNWVINTGESVTHKAMSFSPTGDGHDFLSVFLDEYARLYMAGIEGWESPMREAMDRALFSSCNVTEVKLLENPLNPLKCSISSKPAYFFYPTYVSGLMVLAPINVNESTRLFHKYYPDIVLEKLALVQSMSDTFCPRVDHFI